MARCRETCNHYAYVGDGDAICDKRYPPVWVMEDWKETDKSGWCKTERKLTPEETGQLSLLAPSSKPVYTSPPLQMFEKGGKRGDGE